MTKLRVSDYLQDLIVNKNLKVHVRQGVMFSKATLPEHVILKIREDLTMTPDSKGMYDTNASVTFNLYEESNDIMLVPYQYAYDHITETPDCVMLPEPKTLSTNAKWNREYSLRENQKAPVKACIDAFNKRRGAILKLPCGEGKTVDALFIVATVKLRTIVVVPTVALTHQWAGEIKRFIPEASIGYISGGKFDIDKDIVMAVINSLSLKEYPKGTFDGFGLSIFDECHNYGASNFSKVFKQVRTRYALGLSATPYRNDGLERVFFYQIAPIAYESFVKKIDKHIVVNVITYNIKSDYTVEVRNRDDKPDFTTMVNNLCTNRERTQLGIKYIHSLVKDPLRQILVLSHRREQLQYMNEKLTESGVSCGLYMGQMEQSELDATLQCQVILGIYNLCNEAFNVPKLNTLIMMSPVKNNKRTSKFDQTMGRILRKAHDINPVIVDFYDKFSVFVGLYKTRRGYYASNNKYVVNDIIINSDRETTIPLKTEFDPVEADVEAVEAYAEVELNMDECLL